MLLANGRCFRASIHQFVNELGRLAPRLRTIEVALNGRSDVASKDALIATRKTEIQTSKGDNHA